MNGQSACCCLALSLLLCILHEVVDLFCRLHCWKTHFSHTLSPNLCIFSFRTIKNLAHNPTAPSSIILLLGKTSFGDTFHKKHFQRSPVSSADIGLAISFYFFFCVYLVQMNFMSRFASLLIPFSSISSSCLKLAECLLTFMREPIYSSTRTLNILYILFITCPREL